MRILTGLIPAKIVNSREDVEAKDMIRPADIAESVRMLLRTSPNCLIPEIVFVRTGVEIPAPF